MKLHKSTKEKMVFGVCGGISESTGLDVSLLRLATVVGSIMTGSIILWVYLLLGILLPREN